MKTGDWTTVVQYNFGRLTIGADRYLWCDDPPRQYRPGFTVGSVPDDSLARSFSTLRSKVAEHPDTVAMLVGHMPDDMWLAYVECIDD